MPKQTRDRCSLLALTTAIEPSKRWIADEHNSVAINDFNGGSCFASSIVDRTRERSVLIATTGQLATVLALIGLDGVARRVLLCTPDLAPHLPAIVAEAHVDQIVTDGTVEVGTLGKPLIMCHSRIVSHGHPKIERDIETEWILFTSGTTGRPKMVAHTLSSLSGPLDDGVQGAQVANGAIWSTFYDVRRYGGLQILLRALIGGGSMVLSSAEEAVGDFLMRLNEAGITHISGTPSHWRRALMNPLARAIAPEYVRLSGEIADQPLLDRLRARYRDARVAHAFASTEAGVGFDVRDELAGFPASFVPHPNGNPAIEMRIQDGTLRLRSSRTATRYLGHRLPESDGFIDTGDLVEQRGDRYYFMGRKEGIINVGGLKVYPEEVEAVITSHPAVQMARVWPRKSPIVGAIPAADVVLKPEATDWLTIRAELLRTCHQTLARHKVPVTWQQVEKIEMTVSGKVQRA
jgi:acyl-coenzyme A synthetase/AMP-(fatty) acid ligase